MHIEVDFFESMYIIFKGIRSVIVISAEARNAAAWTELRPAIVYDLRQLQCI